MFFNVNNMKHFDKVISFSKLNVYCIIPKPSWVDFTCILQLMTFICQLTVFMAHARWMKSLPENLSWRRSSNLFQRFFLLESMLHLSFLHLNFTITDSFLFKWWQACKSSGLTSCPVKESALQMFTSSSSSLINGGTGFTSIDSCQGAFVTAFLSNWTTLLVNNLLQFLAIAKSDETTSNLLKKSLNRLDKSESFDDISSTEMSSSISSSFERFSSWHLVQTILVRDDDRI